MYKFSYLRYVCLLGLLAHATFADQPPAEKRLFGFGGGLGGMQALGSLPLGSYPLWKFHKYNGLTLKPVPIGVDVGYGIPSPPQSNLMGVGLQGGYGGGSSYGGGGGGMAGPGPMPEPGPAAAPAAPQQAYGGGYQQPAPSYSGYQPPPPAYGGMSQGQDCQDCGPGMGQQQYGGYQQQPQQQSYGGGYQQQQPSYGGYQQQPAPSYGYSGGQNGGGSQA